MAAPRRLGILISGRGSNMLAIGEAIATEVKGDVTTVLVT